MPFIEDQIRRAIDETATSGVNWCVTLESNQQSENWIQFTSEFVNMYYPHDDDPASRLASIGWPIDSLELDSWEPNTYATFAHGADEALPEISAFIIRYIENVLQDRPSEEEWTISEEDIG